MFKFLKREKGFVDAYIALIISVTVTMLVLVFSVELLILPKAQNTLQTAAEMLARSESINGCVTNNTQTAVSNYLLQNQLDPTKIYFAPPPSSTQSYGTSAGTVAQPNLELGYDLDVFELSSAHIWHQYIQARVPVNISSYVPNAVSDSSGCVSTVVFGGTQVTPGQIGTGSPTNGPSSGITIGQSASSVSVVIPAPAIQGAFSTITGTTNLPLSQVSIFGAGYSASTNADSSGNFSFPAVFTVAGNNQPITVVAGTASRIYTINVITDTVNSVIFTGPSPASVKIGQPFSITGIAYDSKGMVLPDGTQLHMTSSDVTDIPNQTITISSGQFTLGMPSGITQNITSFTVTNTDTTPSTSYSITVTPSDPQKITLISNNITVIAGNSVILSGTVYGYSNTPVQNGTQVQIADNGNSLGAVSTTAGGNYTLTVPLTAAGSNSIVAFPTGFSSVQTTINVTVNPNVPYSAVGLTASPNPVNVGSNTGISGMVKDQYGNLINGQSYTLQTNLSAPNPTSILTTGPFGFNASFSNPGYQTVTLSYGGRTIGSISIQVVSNATANGFTLKASQSAYSIKAGQSVPNILFTLIDSNSNPVPGQLITFTGVAGTPASSTTDVNGQVSFSSSVLTTSGTYTLSATATNIPSLVEMVGITVTPGASNKVVVTISPTTSVVWTVANPVPLPTVFGCVTDIYGNTIPTANVTISGGYGANSSGVVGANGYFSIALTPANIGGPFPLNFAITSAYGNCSTTQGTLTVTAAPVIDTSKVLAGYVINGQTGTMPNKVGSGTVITPSSVDQAFPLGYYGGLMTDGKVAAVVVPAAKVLSGTTIAGTAGTMPNYSGGGHYLAQQNTVGNYDGEGYNSAYMQPSAGYYDGLSWIRVREPNLVPGNIANGVSILGVTGTFQGTPPTHGTLTWTTVGSYSFTVPNSVFSITAVITGGGGGGGGVGGGYQGAGGGAGGFGVVVNIPVTPGQVVPVIVGAGGALGQPYQHWPNGDWSAPWGGSPGGNTSVGSAVVGGGSGGPVSNQQFYCMPVGWGGAGAGYGQTGAPGAWENLGGTWGNNVGIFNGAGGAGVGGGSGGEGSYSGGQDGRAIIQW